MYTVWIWSEPNIKKYKKGISRNTVYVLGISIHFRYRENTRWRKNGVLEVVKNE